MNEPIRILIVEDLAADAELARREISKALPGCVFQCVETREDYMAALDKFQPDLILSDYHMPRFDGMTALKLALERVPLTPVVIWTGSLSEDIAVECMQAGATNYVLKDQLKRLGPALVHALEEKQVRLTRQQAEEQIHYQANLLQNVSDVVISMDLNFNIKSWNQAAADLYGWSAEQVLGQRVDEVLQTEYASELPEQALRQLRAQGLWKGEAIQKCRDGTTIDVLASVSLVKDTNGQPVGVVAVNRDVTARKRAEDGMRESEERFAIAFRANPAAGSIARLSDGRFLDVNGSFLRLTGYRREEVLGKTSLDLGLWANPDDRRKVVELVTRGGGPHQMETQFRTKSGEVRDSILSADLIELGGELCILSSRADITARKRAEEAEHAQRMFAEALRDIAAALNSTLDFDEVLARILANVGRVVPHDAANIMLVESGQAQVVKSRGYGPEATGFTLRTCLRLAEHPKLLHMLEVKQPFFIADTQVDPDWVQFPETAWIRSYLAIPILVKGAVIGILNLDSATPRFFTQLHTRRLQAFADQAAVAIENARLHEEMRADRQELQVLSQRLLAAQEQERTRIAHELHDEIGQILTSVKINLQAMLRAVETTSAAPRLEDSIAVVSQAIQQVRDLGFYLHPSMLDDLGLVAALRSYLDRAARRAGFVAEFAAAAFETRLPPELELTFYRVAQEALTNAARHAQAPRVRVELRREREAIQLTISDNGVGFDTRAVHERAIQGSALGLLGMQERVREAGGQMEIKSELGKGTEIQVRIPCPSLSDSTTVGSPQGASALDKSIG